MILNKFLFICLVCFIVASERVDGVVAVVGSRVVLQSEVLQQTQAKAHQLGVDPYKMPTTFESIFIETANEMVDNFVLLDLVENDTNIVLTQSDVEENVRIEIERRISLVGSLVELERLSGESYLMMKSRLRDDVSSAMKIEIYTGGIYNKTNPTPSDVRVLYEEYKDSLPQKSNYISFSVLEWPVLPRLQKKLGALEVLGAVRDSIVAGGQFVDFAKRHSEDRGSAPVGGALGFVSRGSFVTEYEQVAFSLPEKELSKPFLSPFGYHILLVHERVGEKVNTSHILKQVSIDSLDFAVARDSLFSFLSLHGVDNNVNKFDSLCVHFQSINKNYQGVYNNHSLEQVPENLSILIPDSVGYSDIMALGEGLVFIHKKSFSKQNSRTFKNYYQTFFMLAKNKLVSDYISTVINNHSKKIYVKKNY